MKDSEQDVFARGAEAAGKTPPPLVETGIQDRAELAALPQGR
jgi:hypothetical protein